MAKKQIKLNIPPGLISTTHSNISATTNNIFSYSGLNTKTSYHILGEDVEVTSVVYKDQNLVTNIALINILGKPFLDELHKNRTYFPEEIEQYLDKKFKSIERDNKIDDIIN